MDLRLSFVGRSVREFRSSGRVDLTSLVFENSQLFREPFRFSNLLLAYEGERRRDELRVKGSLKGSRPTLKGDLTLEGLSLKRRRIEVKLSSFSSKESKRRLPWKAMS